MTVKGAPVKRAGTPLSAVYEYLSPVPVEDGEVPSGFVGTRRSRKQSFFQRAPMVVQYSQPLSPRLQSKFRLIALSPDDPSVQADAQWSFHSDVRTSVIDDDMFEIDLGSGKLLVIDLDDAGDWRVSLQSMSGAMLGKPKIFATIDKMLKSLWDYLPDKHRMKYISRVLPVA